MQMNGPTLPTRHPDRNEMERRDLPKLQTLPYVGNSCNLSRFLHSADAAVGMTNQRVLPFIHTGYICNVAGGIIAAPTCTLGRSTVHSYGSYSLRCLAMNHRRYIAYTIYCVVPFNRTGCIWNVAGGRLPPLHARR